MANYALLSVSNKTGIVDFARSLVDYGYTIISSGGTHAVIQAEGIPVMRVSDYTGSPEILDGRVKTLHPKIHGGILAQRDNASHDLDRKVNRIELIDIVAVNLYPFKETVAKPDVTLEDAIENIDIGGPSMVRSAAKNYKNVAVMTNPHQYGIYMDSIKGNLTIKPETLREQFMVEAFRHTAEYDTTINKWMEERVL
jgi:phosphoribosylaminoimidazolecarboxamide formyltransferase/IMP cyclohydrolase